MSVEPIPSVAQPSSAGPPVHTTAGHESLPDPATLAVPTAAERASGKEEDGKAAATPKAQDGTSVADKKGGDADATKATGGDGDGEAEGDADGDGGGDADAWPGGKKRIAHSTLLGRPVLIVGQDVALQAVEDIVGPLFGRAEWGTQNWVPVVFAGPPGCGKTTAARHLADVAKSCTAEVIWIDGTDYPVAATQPTDADEDGTENEGRNLLVATRSKLRGAIRRLSTRRRSLPGPELVIVFDNFEKAHLAVRNSMHWLLEGSGDLSAALSRVLVVVVGNTAPNTVFEAGQSTKTSRRKKEQDGDDDGKSHLVEIGVDTLIRTWKLEPPIVSRLKAHVVVWPPMTSETAVRAVERHLYHLRFDKRATAEHREAALALFDPKHGMRPVAEYLNSKARLHVPKERREKDEKKTVAAKRADDRVAWRSPGKRARSEKTKEDGPRKKKTGSKEVADAKEKAPTAKVKKPKAPVTDAKQPAASSSEDNWKKAFARGVKDNTKDEVDKLTSAIAAAAENPDRKTQLDKAVAILSDVSVKPLIETWRFKAGFVLKTLTAKHRTYLGLSPGAELKLPGLWPALGCKAGGFGVLQRL